MVPSRLQIWHRLSIDWRRRSSTTFNTAAIRLGEEPHAGGAHASRDGSRYPRARPRRRLHRLARASRGAGARVRLRTLRKLSPVIAPTAPGSSATPRLTPPAPACGPGVARRPTHTALRQLPGIPDSENSLDGLFFSSHPLFLLTAAFAFNRRFFS